MRSQIESTETTYIDNSFYDRNDVQRAQDMVHERVVHVAGNNADVSFAPHEEHHPEYSQRNRSAAN